MKKLKLATLCCFIAVAHVPAVFAWEFAQMPNTIMQKSENGKATLFITCVNGEPDISEDGYPLDYMALNGLWVTPNAYYIVNNFQAITEIQSKTETYSANNLASFSEFLMGCMSED